MAATVLQPNFRRGCYNKRGIPDEISFDTAPLPVTLNQIISADQFTTSVQRINAALVRDPCYVASGIIFPTLMIIGVAIIALGQIIVAVTRSKSIVPVYVGIVIIVIAAIGNSCLRQRQTQERMRRFAAAVQQENGTYADSSRITWHIRGGEFSIEINLPQAMAVPVASMVMATPVGQGYAPQPGVMTPYQPQALQQQPYQQQQPQQQQYQAYAMPGQFSQPQQQQPAQQQYQTYAMPGQFSQPQQQQQQPAYAPMQQYGGQQQQQGQYSAPMYSQPPQQYAPSAPPSYQSQFGAPQQQQQQQQQGQYAPPAAYAGFVPGQASGAPPAYVSTV